MTRAEYDALFPTKSGLICDECGAVMFLENGVSHHGEPGAIDYDADRDHTARCEE